MLVFAFMRCSRRVCAAVSKLARYGPTSASEFFGGVLGGIGGYSGVGPAILTRLRGWPKDVARGVYQPFIVVAHVATLATIGTVALDRKA